MAGEMIESQKSSFCGVGAGCVETLRFNGSVAMFDSNTEGHGGARVVTEAEYDQAGFTQEDLAAWELGVGAGEFALEAMKQHLLATVE